MCRDRLSELLRVRLGVELQRPDVTTLIDAIRHGSVTIVVEIVDGDVRTIEVQSARRVRYPN